MFPNAAHDDMADAMSHGFGVAAADTDTHDLLDSRPTISILALQATCTCCGFPPWDSGLERYGTSFLPRDVSRTVPSRLGHTNVLWSRILPHFTRAIATSIIAVFPLIGVS